MLKCNLKNIEDKKNDVIPDMISNSNEEKESCLKEALISGNNPTISSDSYANEEKELEELMKSIEMGAGEKLAVNSRSSECATGLLIDIEDECRSKQEETEVPKLIEFEADITQENQPVIKDEVDDNDDDVQIELVVRGLLERVVALENQEQINEQILIKSGSDQVIGTRESLLNTCLISLES